MKFIPIILVLIVVLVGGYLLFGMQVQPPQPIERQTYTNATYGISFRYPETYELQEREVGDAHRYHYTITLIDKEALVNMPENGEGPPTISMDIFQNNVDQLSLEQWVHGTNFSNFKLSPDGLISSIAIAGVPALSYTWDGLYRGGSVIFAHKGNIVMVSGQYINREDPIVADYREVLSSLELN